MTNQEAIAAIKSNWPTENYTTLRDALNMAIAALSASAPAPAGETVESAITDGTIKEFLSHIVNAVSYKAVEETAGSGFMAATFYVQAFASWLGKRRLSAPGKGAI
jgi:hypothetical protein